MTKIMFCRRKIKKGISLVVIFCFLIPTFAMLNYNRIEFKVGSTLMHFYRDDELVQEKNYYDKETEIAKKFQIMIIKDRSFAPIFAFLELDAAILSTETLYLSGINQYQIKFTKQGDAEKELVLTTGTNIALLNGEKIYLDQTIPDISETVAAVFPIRFIFETFGCKVDWDNDRRVVVVHLPQ